ncbi:MAG TPA: hypothetical protein VFG14_11620 [Chthoniobacteraceae bacterium]|nr:hypothetical protein [Chthoniobacteraceae bacterium]
MHRPGVISTAALTGALLAGIAFLDPAMAGGVRPKFAEPLKDQPDEFLVYRGFPNPVTEKGLYEAEIKKDTQILPNGAAIAVKTFSSFDETFYRQPLEISGKDGIRIQKILGQCTPAFDSENPFARGKYPHQANFKIFYAQAGYGYNVHIYVPLKAILLYRSNGSGSPLRLNDRLFQELIAILSK